MRAVAPRSITQRSRSVGSELVENDWSKLEIIMRMSWKILSAVLFAASLPCIAGPASATPLSSSLGLKSADTASVESVQWRRGHRGRWIGPAAGFAAGVAVGGALAPRYYGSYGYYGYYGYDDAYAYSPGYAYAPARGYRGYGYRGGTCSSEESENSANPSWACPSPRW
jgi:hypothetical protein